MAAFAVVTVAVCRAVRFVGRAWTRVRKLKLMTQNKLVVETVLDEAAVYDRRSVCGWIRVADRVQVLIQSV